MKNTTKIIGACLTAILAVGGLTGCFNRKSGDQYEGDRLVLNLKNVYFDTWDGTGDTYTEHINEMFGVKIKASNYDYSDWDGSVYTAINGNNLTDTIHFNLKAYNYGSTYERWVADRMLKPLPDDLSKWPNVQSLIASASNVDKLKIDGHLYGIPILNDIVKTEKDFSNFTFVYRRDWAKKIDELNKGKAGYTPIYNEGDVYTWDEFERLLAAFKTNLNTLTGGIEGATVIEDEPWGFPSVANLYKDAPHCYTKDASGKAICAFTSDKFISGIEKAKEFVDKGYYSLDNPTFGEGKANKDFVAGKTGILYDNFSLANYITLRNEVKTYNNKDKTFNLDDGTAFLKVKGPDGNFAIEGTENWFSMTLFSYEVSDNKMSKILDIINYLLSEEGTRLAVYGLEGYDYDIVDGKVVLNETSWEKDEKGNYAKKINGAKYLRYMATLGNDTKAIDPYTDMDAYNIVDAWYSEMKTQKDAGHLRVVKEPADISWMSTPTKNDKTESLLNDANTDVHKYCIGKNGSIDDYKKKFNTSNWNTVLAEINAKLGF